MSNLSTFPTTVDTFQVHNEIQAADIPNLQLYQQLVTTANRTPDQDTQLANLTTQLRDKLFLSTDFNLMQDAITNVQNFFLSETQGYIQSLQSTWNATLQKFTSKGTYNPSTTYVQWNTVSYNSQTYMSLQDNNTGHIPVGGSGDSWWQLIAAQGIQGIAGVNLSYQGVYSNTVTYQPNQAVNYNGTVYQCIQQSIGNTPSSSPAYWIVFLSASPIPVQNTAPTSPTSNQLWIDTSS